jgi:hypothetical protein
LRQWNLCHMHAARKDSAVHVSLSSDSPVKQPGARHPSLRTRQRVCEAVAIDTKPMTNPESEELRGRAMPPSGGAPCLRHICSTVGYCQPCILEFFITSSYAGAASVRAHALVFESPDKKRRSRPGAGPKKSCGDKAYEGVVVPG